MTLSAEDRSALSDLVHRYAANVDDREFDAVAALFIPNAELAVPEPPAHLIPVRSHRGTEAIAAAVSAVAAVARTQHAIVGEVYDSTARTGIARARVACVAHHWSQRGDELTDVVWHLRYDDDYERTERGWRIARRALTINAIEARPARRLLPPDPRTR